ncbi:LptF/LptG family permease [Flavobacterium aciduliphilum]|uniref:Lipopolysaccharide export system permease protein n=1 Tax=Flavobacterium aciduliphilum TaxID=1101402 RepID=A0A328Y7M6_9FLAO|nr:LptF/LptG family permease [Flavobacterium aciduliphilum]RAR69969.1 lipopolysaccharide export system permease protein [Flavobacterium aciduliphilum]
MKILDKYLLKTFLITFTTVFVILFFIFILQTVWLFISELAGKDLDGLLVLKFLLFSMPRIVPLVLPLSVLLASIMTFGSLAENYEFAAMKSSGISFQRTMRSITLFILFLSVISFFFANSVIPYAEYKFMNFRRNIAQVKPAMAITEGQFCEIGNYTIKVEKKIGEKGNFLKGVTIHKKLENGEGNTTVIKAEKGELISSESSNTLKLVLTNGTYYEDVIPNKIEDRIKIPFAKGTFKKDVINIDLSKLNQNNMNSIDISNTNTMLNINELRFTIDSLNQNYKKDLKSYVENIYLRTGATSSFYPIYGNKPVKKITTTDLFQDLNSSQKIEVLKIASNTIENTILSIGASTFEMENKEKNINGHWIALYDKFMIAFSCILMFFIGAPLGSIIRKGGLGLPIVFAVAIFIIFHFVNTFGKRVAQENGMSAFMGVWMSSLILTPLAVFLTLRAINDIDGMISFDVITEPLKTFFSSLTNPNTEKNTIQQIDAESILELPVLEIEAYHVKQKMLLLVYGITFLFGIGAFYIKNTIVIIGWLVMCILFLFFVFKSQKQMEKIAMKTQINLEPGIIISLLIAIPFYGLLYFYNSKIIQNLEQNLSKHN